MKAKAFCCAVKKITDLVLSFLNMRNLSLGFMIAGIWLLLNSCRGDDDVRVVDFISAKPTVNPMSPADNSPSLRVAVAAMLSPQDTFVYHRRLLDYIGKHLGRKIEFIQRQTYSEINELIAMGQIDLAFICSGPYALGRDKFKFELLATPEIRGSHFYRSYLIVNRDSPYQLLDDLEGRVFAFTDPESNTGRLVPVFWLAQKGKRPETFFGKTIYTYSHDNSILAVARNLVDGASVDGIIWEYYNYKNPILTSATRIIMKSKPYGIPPLVTSEDLSAELKTRIRKVLFSMHLDVEGKKILKELMIDRFIPAREEWYEPIRQMQSEISSLEEKPHAAKNP